VKVENGVARTQIQKSLEALKKKFAMLQHDDHKDKKECEQDGDAVMDEREQDNPTRKQSDENKAIEMKESNEKCTHNDKKLQKTSRPLPKATDPNRGIVGLQNLSNTCYLNAAIQEPLARSGLIWSVKFIKKKKKKTPGRHTINIGKLRSRLGAIETRFGFLFIYLFFLKTDQIAQVNNRFLQGVQEDSYAAICTLVGALEEKTPLLDYCLECKEKSPEEETELAEKMFAQICKESRIAAIFDGVSLERETCKSCGTISNHYQSFRNLTLPVVGLELFVDIVCVHNSSFVISLSLPISAKVRTLKYLLNEKLHKPMDELCLRYVNLESNRANELVIVANDCDDISNFITKKKGFFCACQVVDIIRPPSNSLEKEKDQFIIIPVLQCMDGPDGYDYNCIRYCKVSRGSQYNSAEIVQELGYFHVDEQSLCEATLFYGDKQIDIAKKQSICFDESLPLIILFYDRNYRDFWQVG
ncbi:hypothetical protein RFI_40107, partial [Reticulomyxa filosa]